MSLFAAKRKRDKDTQSQSGVVGLLTAPAATSLQPPYTTKPLTFRRRQCVTINYTVVHPRYSKQLV